MVITRRGAELRALKGRICQHNETGGVRRCMKKARVRVALLFKAGETRTVTMLRCWEHYADIENVGRLSKTFDVTNVEVIPW